MRHAAVTTYAGLKVRDCEQYAADDKLCTPVRLRDDSGRKDHRRLLTAESHPFLLLLEVAKKRRRRKVTPRTMTASC
jgi:hypothetical protein